MEASALIAVDQTDFQKKGKKLKPCVNLNERKSMKVISAWKDGKDGEKLPVDREQYNKDYPNIVATHNKMKKTSPTWQYFGGTVDIEDRHYQVA